MGRWPPPRHEEDIPDLLRQTDTDDRRLIYLAWCEIGWGPEVVPFVARAFGALPRRV